MVASYVYIRFLAAMIVTIAIGNRGDSSNSTEYF